MKFLFIMHTKRFIIFESVLDVHTFDSVLLKKK